MVNGIKNIHKLYQFIKGRWTGRQDKSSLYNDYWNSDSEKTVN